MYHGTSQQRRHTELEDVDIVLTTYETLRSEWSANGALYSKKWLRLVLDEGRLIFQRDFCWLKRVLAHHIRNRMSQTFKAACAVSCRYRWCLTGTPIHNSLDDYGSLLSFIGVPLLTEKRLFDYWITDPLKSGRPDSLRRLQQLVKITCLRRTKKAIGHTLTLPERAEQTEALEFHPRDLDIYNFFKERAAVIATRNSSEDRVAANSTQSRENNILSLINFLRLICNHGSALLPQSAISTWIPRDFASADWQMKQKWHPRCDLCDGDIEGAGASIRSFRDCENLICLACATSRDQSNLIDENMTCPKCFQGSHDSEDRVPPDSQMAPAAPSPKIEALLRNLHREQRQAGDSGLVGTTKRYVR